MIDICSLISYLINEEEKVCPMTMRGESDDDGSFHVQSMALLLKGDEIQQPSLREGGEREREREREELSGMCLRTGINPANILEREICSYVYKIQVCMSNLKGNYTCIINYM